MIKWIIISAIVLIVTVFVIRILKVMLKAEKDSNKIAESQPAQTESYKEFDANTSSISTGSGTNNIVTDMSNHKKDEFGSAFYDDLDSEFNDYRRHARRSNKNNSFPDGFDFDGDRSDEYIPDSPEFSYIPRRQPPKKKPIDKELNEMPTELKVLMLSDIFDRKFFD